MKYFNGDFLLDYGVIALSITYRMGPLGFLSVAGDPILTGNQVKVQMNSVPLLFYNYRA